MCNFKIKLNTFAFFLIISPVLLFGQHEKTDFPTDTSFSVWSATQKITKDFPIAIPVKAFDLKEIKSERNVVYYELGDRRLHTDLFYPNVSNKKIPAVILIHGGGWASGNKSHMVPMAQKLANAGFFAAAVEYRLSPEAIYPAGVKDIKSALVWLKQNATKFNVDTSRIAILGTSAGATLASLIGTTAANPLFKSHQKTEVNDRVHAIINIDGILDFTDPAESGKDTSPDKPSAGARWFGYTYAQKPELWIQASPLNYVNENTPPTLFINSSIPRFHAGREAFVEVLENNHQYYEIHTLPETPHPFWLFYPWFDKATGHVILFLNKIFTPS